MCDGAWWPGGVGCFSEEVGLSKALPQSILWRSPGRSRGEGTRRAEGEGEAGISTDAEVRGDKRVPVHEKLFSLYMKVSPPIDGIISILNITVLFA